MKFAAKRTWPDKAATWEHQDEANDAQAFASEFATLEQLTVDTEFVVMCKDGADQTAHYFRVAAVNPYQLEPATARSSSAAPESATVAETETPADDDDAAPVGMPNLSPVISMVFYMGKVAFIATAGIALMAVGISALRRFLE